MTRNRAILGGAIIVALLLSFGAGRYTAPERVRVEERVREVQVQGEAREVVREVRVAGESHEVVRWRTVTVEKPGERVTTVVTERGADTSTATTDATRATEVKVEYRDREVEKLKVVEKARPQWSAGARVGMGLDRSVAYGGEVSRRIWGPLSVGVWGDSHKQAGVGLRWEW